ncbi:MAG: hypothetical protein KDH09_07050 [Chrysiogenetes bacterium]|nr:hypothetical protein [Chrysiogenetes bacterium]
MLALAIAGCARPVVREESTGVVSGLGTEFFSENFDKGEPWGQGKGSACERSYAEGRLVVQNVSEDRTCELDLWLVGPLPPRVRIELSAQYVDGPESADFGLKFGYKPLPEAGFHTFTVKAGGVFSVASYNGTGQWENLTRWRPDPFVYTGRGRANKLALEIRGRELRYFANGALLGQLELAHAPEGYVGLYLDAPGLVVHFDDFRVVNLPVSAAPDGEAAE